VGEPIGDGEPTLPLGEQHHPAVGGVIRPPSKAALSFFRATAGSSKGKGISSFMASLSRLDHCIASAAGNPAAD
jgi:hypothetical protein